MTFSQCGVFGTTTEGACLLAASMGILGPSGR